MIFGVILDPDEQERERIHQYLSKFTAYHTDEELQLKTFQKSSLLLSQLESADLLDLAVVDVTMEGGFEAARAIRKMFPTVEIMIVADVTVSPMKYMCPSIRASALLLRPVSPGWEDAVREFFFLLADQEKEDKNDTLWIENRKGIFRVPFDQICYLEAREKKVFVRTLVEEMGIAGTLEKLAEKLPDNFKRCHRSFIVNTEHIVQIKLSENQLNLRGGLFVPISRSYRNLFKRNADE